ncbi:hypothetical protein OHC33_003593 [Knufia fluminis]|uniref:HAUS augmin-like complex subunit 6 N-terminal domain-containing protein n=1 Tax=Knufia fluminis TaxID=191047 RepID=A0AAN8EG11_9EURO|nr:hypothetical protein OHC33_003593 [Knufia fluminis]
MSSQTPAWPGRSHVSVFVHSLHLLDLDQLDDWPEVTIQSFATKASLQHRIRCVEWSLYRLFELYDVRATKDKLRPFFPPSTSLQSVNLRAALLRQLTELKKDGVLGPTVILRKTMLDECKGDKFEELLATFSMLVLKKRFASTGDPLDSGPTKTSNVVPLVLSFRKGIQRDLEKRKELELQARHQKQNTDAKIEAVLTEAAILKRKKAPEIPEHADSLTKIVRENWIGDHAWVETILHGIAPSSSASEGSPQDDREPDDPSRLLDDLHARVKAHGALLAQWQSYLKTLQERSQKQPQQERVPHKDQSRSARFARHQNLVVRAHTTRAPSGIDDIAKFDPCQQLKPQHATLLQSLDRELSIQRPRATTVHTTQLLALTGANQGQSVAHLKEARPLPARTDSSTSSDVSSQRTVVEERPSSQSGNTWSSPPIVEKVPLRSPISAFAADESLPPKDTDSTDQLSLMERTRASLAQFETPRGASQNTPRITKQNQNEPGPTVVTSPVRPQSDRASLLERTRQSMSMLTNVLDDSYQQSSRRGARRPTHARSKTAILVPQGPRLERAWSEESLASTATKEDVDVDADYDSVFKSRPRLAMSPNLSPQGTSNDLWLESQLEEGMNKLTIDSSPDV